MPPPATPRLGEPHARLSIRPEGGSPPAGGSAAGAAVIAASRASAAPRVRIEVDEATAATTTGSGPGASSAAAGTTLRARSGRAGRAGRASRAGAARRTLAVTLHGPGSDAQGGGAAERVVAAGAFAGSPAGHRQGLGAAVGSARAPEHQVVRRPGHDGPAERTCD